MESLEIFARSSMHRIGGKMIEEILNLDDGDYQGRALPCSKGHNFEFEGYRNKELMTVLGPVTIKRSYYYDKECNKGFCPKDKDLDIEDTTYSPGVRRIMARVGAYRPFALGQKDIKEMAGINVNSKAIDRYSNILGKQVASFSVKESGKVLLGNVVPIKKIPIMYICMDGTGVPVVKSELVGRKGKGDDGEGKTREAKLGCIFTQTTVNDDGYPIRDENSTTYVGSIETAEEFSYRIKAEAIRRYADRAEKICVIGDGAKWIWNIANDKFRGAIQILDFYHAGEHYWNVAKVYFKSDKKRMKQWAGQRRKELKKGKPEKVIEAIGKLITSCRQDKELFEKEMNYFETNKERMRYNEYRKQGFFVGSGVLEAGCRTVIGQRLKQSGMHWTVNAANNLISLRCCFLSNQWEDFWEYRACC